MPSAATPWRTPCPPSSMMNRHRSSDRTPASLPRSAGSSSVPRRRLAIVIPLPTTPRASCGRVREQLRKTAGEPITGARPVRGSEHGKLVRRPSRAAGALGALPAIATEAGPESCGSRRSRRLAGTKGEPTWSRTAKPCLYTADVDGVLQLFVRRSQRRRGQAIHARPVRRRRSVLDGGRQRARLHFRRRGTAGASGPWAPPVAARLVLENVSSLRSIPRARRLATACALTRRPARQCCGPSPPAPTPSLRERPPFDPARQWAGGGHCGSAPRAIPCWAGCSTPLDPSGGRARPCLRADRRRQSEHGILTNSPAHVRPTCRRSAGCPTAATPSMGIAES